MSLLTFHDITNRYEIGVDECARGPLFGRVYTSACVLPKDGSFRHDWMKDSKKIKSKKKMRELSDYIKENALAYHIDYIEASVIDDINIRQAVLRSMRNSIRSVLATLDTTEGVLLVVDGNDFPPYTQYNEVTETMYEIPSMTVEKGDGTYTFIAAASILAKNAHDEYILKLCEENPYLKERYSLHENMGYGTAKHIAGIKAFGTTEWHRKSFKVKSLGPQTTPCVLSDDSQSH
jgi:ribonuclease HII